MTETLYDELGGKSCLERVHRIFYGKLLDHAWLKDFFVGRPRWHLESQQTDFMMSLFGGPQIYSGRMPKSAHLHLFITEEVFLLRHDLLAQSLNEAGVRADLKARWLDYDMKMKRALTKTEISECVGRHRNDPVISVEKPSSMCPRNSSTQTNRDDQLSSTTPINGNSR